MIVSNEAALWNNYSCFKVDYSSVWKAGRGEREFSQQAVASIKEAEQGQNHPFLIKDRGQYFNGRSDHGVDGQ